MCKRLNKNEKDESPKNPRECTVAQKNYNSTHSKIFKNLYFGFEIPSMILAAAVPIILIETDICPLVPAIVSGISALLHSISHFAGFQKKWINCRNLTEQLKSELRKYDSEIYEYENKQLKDKILAKKLETIVASGNDFWIQVVNEKKDDEK